MDLLDGAGGSATHSFPVALMLATMSMFVSGTCTGTVVPLGSVPVPCTVYRVDHGRRKPMPVTEIGTSCHCSGSRQRLAFTAAGVPYRASAASRTSTITVAG